MNQPLRIDIVSDVVCPWCVIGYNQLLAALEATDTEAEIYWHPFELNPDMPAEGQNLREHLIGKYQITPEQSAATREHITKTGADVGFDFNFADDMRIVNTFDAHRLIHWAGTFDKATEMKEALFAAYFTDGRDVSDRGVLGMIVMQLGLDLGAARELLNSDQYAEEVRDHEGYWTSQGIRSVPAMIFDEKYLVNGAQGVEAYVQFLTDLREGSVD